MLFNMKNRLLLLTAFLVGLAACKKDEKKVYFEGGTAPVLTASRTTTIPLSFVNKDQEAIKLSWTNPNYSFTTGTSSQNVTYQVEIDTTGANFTNPNKKTIAISNNLGVSFTQGEFNDFLLNQLLLDSTMSHNIEIRVRSAIGSAVPLYSNVLKYTVKPYAIPPKVDPPPTGKLFITGSATPASWQCGCGEPELASQQFTRVNNTLYVLPSIALTGGGSYLLLPQYGSWSAKYGGLGSNNSNNVDGDDFKANGGDLLAPPVSGNYKIEVNFQTGKFKLTKL